MKLPIGTTDARVATVSDNEYSKIADDLVRKAKVRCLASVFIIDALPNFDQHNTVYSLLKSLQAANWRGVDVRILVGGTRRNLAIAETSKTATDILHSLGIENRWLTARESRGSHAKFLVVDDQTLIGSHNWSSGAFTNQIQDSVLIYSAGLASYVVTIFEEQWKRASL